MRRIAWKVFLALALMLVISSSEALSARSLSQSSTVSPGSSPGLNVSWSAFQRFTTIQEYDFDPAIIQTFDGTIWVFWELGPFATPWFQSIVYKTYNGTTWSNQQTAAFSRAQNVAPSVAQLKNGTLYLSYSSNRTGNFEIFLKRYNPGIGWSSDYQLTNTPNDNVVSALVAARDGSLWAFWDRQTTTINLYYKVWRNGAWSAETALTNDVAPFRDQQPTAYQTADGNIWVAWSQVQDANFNKVHIMYEIYNGVSWGTTVQLTSSSQDTHPALFQDSNGTLWMTWSREISYSCTGGGCTQQDIIYNTSTNNGASWGSEVNLTNDVGCSDPNCFDDDQPTMAEFTDGRIYLFWSTNRDPQNYWNLYYITTNPLPLHNVAVTKVVGGPATVRGGGSVTVNVTVANKGFYGETFELDVWATNKTTIQIVSRGVYLDPGGSFTLSFIWNTPWNRSGPPPGRYVLSASIPPLPNEYFIYDNNATGNTVWVVPPGDVDMDGSVTVSDLGIVALAYKATPGSPKWNPIADLNGDGSVGIDDLALVALWYHVKA